MNGVPTKKVTGVIENIIAKGAGQNSGEAGIGLLSPHQSYWIFMDTPPDDFLRRLGIAFKAMWNQQTVEITYSQVGDGDNLLLDIRVA